jgi:hypothetical protein
MRARTERICSPDGFVPLHGSQLPQPIGDLVPSVIHHCSSHGVLGAQGWLEEAMDFITKGGEVLALKEELETTRAEREKFRQEALKEPRPRTGGADVPIVLLIDSDSRI